MSETNQCTAIILRTGERCKKRHIGENYCIYHGPFCQALTLKGLPCNSMVRKFREGFIYCDLHFADLILQPLQCFLNQKQQQQEILSNLI